MSQILFVENLSLETDNPMSICYPTKCQAIANDNRFAVYDISTDSLDLNKLEQFHTVIFGCRSIYLYKCYKGSLKRKLLEKNKKLSQIKNKFFIIQDMHKKTYGNINYLCNFLNGYQINIIFTFYHNAEANEIRNKTPDLQHYHLYHHIDTNIFKPMNLERKYDIFLYGAIHPKHYPFRKRLFELILANKDKFNVHHIEKPEKFDPEVCGEGLAKLINMSKICIATKSRYDYLVSKYFEIIMGKTLIAGDIPADGISLLNNRIIELDDKMSDEQIIIKLKDALDNYAVYKDQIEYLYRYVNTNYGLDNYVNKLYSIVKLIA